MESVLLTGSAVHGILPSDPAQANVARTAASSLPLEVKLGRIRPKQKPRVLRLSDYFDAAKVHTPPPPSINRRDKAKASIGRMYLNDQYGDCVVAGKAHALGLWSANDSDSGGEVLGTDREILDQYHRWCGPGDNGCVITEVLDAIRDGGMTMNGRRYAIDGYVECDWTNKTLVQLAQYLFGATTIGIDLPADWTRSDVWDVTNSSIVGGHDVTPIDYDERGVYVSSWGRIYLITWPAFTSRRWLSEMYVMLSPTWYGSDKLAPSGFDVTRLKAAIDAIGSGTLPDIDPPAPPPPPGPPGAGYRIVIPAGLPAGDYTVGGAGPGVDPVALRQAINALLALFGYPPLPAPAVAEAAAGAVPWSKVVAILAILMTAFSKPLTPAELAALVQQILAILQS